MRFICADPLGAINRVSDMARRLGIVPERLSYQRRGDGCYVLSLDLLQPDGAEGRLFRARLATLLDLLPETADP